MISFRKLSESDRSILSAWIAADSDHAPTTDAEFFYDTPNMVLVLCRDGNPGIYLRMDPEPFSTLRLHIQFSPDKLLSAKTLLGGWPTFLDCIIRSRKISRLVFESTSPLLIRFCERSFYFHRVPDTNDYEFFISLPKEDHSHVHHLSV